MDVPVDYHVWIQCRNTIKDTRQNWPTKCRDKRLFCGRYRMICFTSSLIRQLYYFATDFDSVLLQVMGTDTENSLFKYRAIYRHLTFMIELTFELLIKAVKKIVHIQCATACSLKNSEL